MKRCWMRAEKASIIHKLQATVNNLKGTLLERGHEVRASEECNYLLTQALTCAQRRTTAWMITPAVSVLMLFTMFATAMT